MHANVAFQSPHALIPKNVSKKLGMIKHTTMLTLGRWKQ